MEYQITEIDWNHVPQLRDLYKSRNLENDITYVTIDTYIRWFQQDPQITHLRFFCLNGNFSNGTFVVTDRAEAYADTLHESSDELRRLLMLLDYSKGHTFISINDRVATVLLEVTKQKRIEIINHATTLAYKLSKDDALKFDIEPPDGIVLKQLNDDSDLKRIFSSWEGGKQRTAKFFTRQAKYSPSVGAFKKDGTLVAWVLMFSTGFLCSLQTDKHHYGHGYGSLVTKAITKQVAEMGHNVYSGIFEQNIASKRLFEKLGYIPIGKVHWVCTKISWSDDEQIPIL